MVVLQSPPGGGQRQYIRMVDFKRNKIGIPAKVLQLNMIPTAIPPGTACLC